METKNTLLLNRSDIQELLDATECIDAVEKAFRLQGEGKIPHPEF
jgi:ornithine cyclodeaminase/alanine dehydrogenase-like protein (mu-crystallin family)